MASNKRLGDLLLDADMLSKEDLDKALRLQVGGNRRLGYLLIKLGIISEIQLHTILSKQLDLPIVAVKKEFDIAARNILPKYLCRKYSVIPLQTLEGNILRLAMVDPSDAEAVTDIEKYTGLIIRPVLASKSDITAGIKSSIPWSFRDFLNPQSFNRITAAIAILALLLVTVIATQIYRDRMQERYGKVTKTDQTITYENLELILGIDQNKTISLLGRGAYSSGYYSVTFTNPKALEDFIRSKKDGFSAKQLEWLNWAMKNPHQNK